MIDMRTVEIEIGGPEARDLADAPSRALTDAEIRAAGSGAMRIQRMAARLAAKQAFAGAFPGFPAAGIEILSDESGRPEIRLLAPPPAGLRAAHVSLTHTDARAAALVVVERDETGHAEG